MKVSTVQRINPATFLPAELGEPDHDGLGTAAEVPASRPDLRDQPLHRPDLTFCTDGSRYMTEGKRMVGYAVVDNEKITEAKPLLAG